MLLLMERMMLTYLQIYMQGILIIDVLRIYVGPFPGKICWIYKLGKNLLATGGVLLINFMVIIRVNIYFLILQIVQITKWKYFFGTGTEHNAQWDKALINGGNDLLGCYIFWYLKYLHFYSFRVSLISIGLGLCITPR